MKLIHKTLLSYLLISLPLLIMGGLIAYYDISDELEDAVDSALKNEEFYIEKALSKKVKPENLSSSGLYKVDTVANTFYGCHFSNVLKYDSLEDETIKYRTLTCFFNNGEQNYRIQISKPSMEEEELREGLLSSFAILGTFLLFGFFLVNWLLAKLLWTPFYQTLEKLKTYELKNHIPENFMNSSTTEFNNLNKALNQMTHKIHTDFLQQKEFTENASHEMQTPLAIIKANVSLLMQSPNIKLEEMNQIQAIDDTAKKLASLNKALLLLAKIENNQFKETALMDISIALKKVISHVEDLLETKQINLQSHIEGPIVRSMNPTLVDILITNLIQNAIRHNYQNGEIKVELKGDELIISNTGRSLAVDPNELFSRFKKNEGSSDSIGLGLAIVKSICVLYNIDIHYKYLEDQHQFILRFHLNS